MMGSCTKIEAIICDLDGTLIDSERPAIIALKKALLELGYQVSYPDLLRCVGYSFEEMKQHLEPQLGNDVPWDKISARRSEILSQYYDQYGLKRKPGVDQLVNLLEQHSLPRAIVTNSTEVAARKKLTRTELLSFFDSLVTADTVLHHKPDEEGFEEARQRICLTVGHEILAENVCVIGDAPSDVIGAIKAKMISIQVPDLAKLYNAGVENSYAYNALDLAVEQITPIVKPANAATPYLRPEVVGSATRDRKWWQKVTPGFVRAEINRALAKNPLDADALLRAFEFIPGSESFFSEQATREGYSIRGHTRSWLQQYTKYHAASSETYILNQKAFLLLGVLHDITKVMRADKQEQHRSVVKFIEEYRWYLPLSNREIEIITGVIEHSAIGNYIQQAVVRFPYIDAKLRLSEIYVSSQLQLADLRVFCEGVQILPDEQLRQLAINTSGNIKAFAKRLQLDPTDLLDLMILYSQTDLSSYTLDAPSYPDDCPYPIAHQIQRRKYLEQGGFVLPSQIESLDSLSRLLIADQWIALSAPDKNPRCFPCFEYLFELVDLDTFDFYAQNPATSKLLQFDQTLGRIRFSSLIEQAIDVLRKCVRESI